jgi:FkbM family methyltransferase
MLPFWCRCVPGCGWNSRGAISGNMKVSFQAAGSIISGAVTARMPRQADSIRFSSAVRPTGAAWLERCRAVRGADLAEGRRWHRRCGDESWLGLSLTGIPTALSEGSKTAGFSRSSSCPVVAPGRMEIVLGRGQRVIVDNGLDAAALALVIGLLERWSRVQKLTKGGMRRANPRENDEIRPSTSVRAGRGVSNRRHLASVLQEGRNNSNIHVNSRVIRGIPANILCTPGAVMIVDRVIRRAAKVYKRLLYKPNLTVTGGQATIRLGTTYGGWRFVDHPTLYNSTILSAGLGEDASFDIEFAAKYGAKIIIVDPTPRSIEHFRQICNRLGMGRAAAYREDGRQAVESYDLSNIKHDQIVLVPVALWNKAGTTKFFAPRNSEHVSHSIVSDQKGCRNFTSHIEVPTKTVDIILMEQSVANVTLMKLDIEGAEIEVIHDILAKGILPTQILVEFDELSAPSARSKAKVETTYKMMLGRGYRLISREGLSNFLFVHNSMAR